MSGPPPKTRILEHSNVTAFAVPVKYIRRREVVFAALGAAENLANLVLGAKMVDKPSLCLEHLVAQLTDELQQTRQPSQ